MLALPAVLRIDAPEGGRHVARRFKKPYRHPHKMTDQTAARRDMANAIRALAMDAVEQANSGHPGMPMGMADVATVLFTKFLKFDAADPHWPDRDRFVLSAGHGSMLLYSLLYLTGYEDMTLDELKHFRQLGSQDRRPSGIRPCAAASRPPPARSARASPIPSAWRSPSACWPRASARDLVDHYTYVHRRRRLPDGRHQPGGDHARRPSQARQADRAVRRQRHLDRRPDLARDLRRPA